MLYNGHTTEHFQRSFRKTLQELEAGPLNPLNYGIERGGTVSALDAQPIFEQQQRRLIEFIQPHVTRFSSARWLFLLRRLSNDVFSGSRRTTLGYSRILAEVLTEETETVDTAAVDATGTYVFPTDDAQLRHLGRLVAVADCIYDIHVHYRFAGKNCSFRSSRDDGILVPIVADDTRRAIEAYDTRNENSGAGLQIRLGIASLADLDRKQQRLTPDTVDIVLSWRLLDRQQLIRVGTLCERLRLDPPLDYPAKSVLRTYEPSLISVDDIGAVFRTGEASINVTLPLEFECNLLLLMIASRYVTSGTRLLRTIEVGYFILPEDEFHSRLESYFTPCVALLKRTIPNYAGPQCLESLVSVLENCESNLWPLHQLRSIRRTKGFLMIDVRAATVAVVMQTSLVPKDGRGANVRAYLFEDRVQNIIDQTAWRPSARASVFRGRTLKRGNSPLTNIDAVGERDDTLLIVSCKSIPYSKEYDRGVFSAVRNASTTVRAAIERWQDVAQTLRRQPKGRNYDVTRWKQIVPIVCTPFAVYTEDERALSFALPSLRSVCSAEELLNGLTRN